MKNLGLQRRYANRPGAVDRAKKKLAERDLRHAARRQTPDGIIEAVAAGGRIQIDTLRTLLALLAEKTDYDFHVAVEITVVALLKTIDNEADALETIERLKKAPAKARPKAPLK